MGVDAGDLACFPTPRFSSSFDPIRSYPSIPT